MDIGDRVQHFNTGSVGTVIDSVYSMGSDFQQMCVQWEDDKAPREIRGNVALAVHHSAPALRFHDFRLVLDKPCPPCYTVSTMED